MSRLANRYLLIAVFLLFTAGSAQAHSFWLLPSSTVLSSAGQWITVDAARSNDPFFFNHNAMRLDRLEVESPAGGDASVENRHDMHLRSVFDVRIAQAGTYQIANLGEGLMARYEVNGDSQRWFGEVDTPAADIPDAARDAGIRHYLSRADTFVTAGAPTRDVLEPTGRGLELIPETHPNDLYTDETATFRLLVDGAPASGVEVEIVPGDVRYRSQRDGMTKTTDSNGEFTVTWPRAGMYLLETGTRDDHVGHDAANERRLSYSATFEVLPL